MCTSRVDQQTRTYRVEGEGETKNDNKGLYIRECQSWRKVKTDWRRNEQCEDVVSVCWPREELPHICRHPHIHIGVGFNLLTYFRALGSDATRESLFQEMYKNALLNWDSNSTLERKGYSFRFEGLYQGTYKDHLDVIGAQRGGKLARFNLKDPKECKTPLAGLKHLRRVLQWCSPKSQRQVSLLSGRRRQGTMSGSSSLETASLTWEGTWTNSAYWCVIICFATCIYLYIYIYLLFMYIKVYNLLYPFDVVNCTIRTRATPAFIGFTDSLCI